MEAGFTVILLKQIVLKLINFKSLFISYRAEYLRSVLEIYSFVTAQM